jgi:subtilase family serine protease
MQINCELPDLEIAEENATFENFVSGMTGIIYVNIENKGNVDLYTVPVKYALKDLGTNVVIYQGNVTKDCLKNWTTTITIYISNLSYGDYLFTVIVDPENIIEESDETNNAVEKTFHVSASDLIVTEISFSNPTPKVDEEIRIIAEAKNIGEASTIESFKIGIYEGESLIDEKEIEKLDPGAFISVFTYWTPKIEGDIEIKVKVDLREEIDEMDENNNSLTHSITTEKLEVFILSNAIDWGLQGESLEVFLESNKIDVQRIFPSNFDSYKNEAIIIILGGPDAYSGVGYIVSQILGSSSVNYLRTEGAYNVFLERDIFTANQLIIVMAGNDRDLTAKAIIENKNLILSYIKP